MGIAIESKQKGVRCMKSKKMIIMLIAIIILGFSSVGGMILQKIHNSSAAMVEGDKVKNVPDKNSAYPLGTALNPFLILEIVPFEGFAEIGYNIAGQEPVDIEVLSWSEKGGNIASTNALEARHSNIQTFSPNKAMLDANNYRTRIVPQDGCYKRVEANQGNYIQTSLYRDASGKVTGANFQEVADNTGDFVLEWLEYNPSRSKNDQNKDKIYTTKNSILYEGDHYEYKHKNTFLKECLQLTDNEIPSYQIRVVTVTSQQLNNNLDLIDKADLIYLTDKSHMGTTYIDIWKDPRFRRDDMFQYNEVGITDYNNCRFINGRDLCWEAVVKILQKKSGWDLAEGVNPCPVIYDVNSLTSSIPMTKVIIEKKTKTSTYSYRKECDASENNVYKLGLFMRYDNTAKLYDLYFRKNMIVTGYKVSDGMTTGLFCNPDGSPISTYWCPFILIPYHLVEYNGNSNIMNSNVEKLGYYASEGYTDLYNTMAKDGMYIYNANTSIVMQFNSSVVPYTSQTKEVFEYYNLGSANMITPAQIIRYLLDRVNDGANIPSISILEIQPFEDYKQNWETYIKGLLPSFRGSLKITSMTSKEFICRIEELVGSYDMVYLGMNKERALDYQKVDLAFDSLAFSHVGKRMLVKDDWNMAGWMLKKAGNFYTRYSGNDITKLKMQELINYIEVGYPIMLATNMLKDNQIASEIDISSNLFKFINTAKSADYKERLLCENTVTGATLSQLLKKSSCDVEFIELPTEYQDAITHKKADGSIIPASEIYINGASDDKKVLSYRFKIVEDGSDSIYSAALYLDQNADGLFDQAREKLDDISIKDLATNTIVDEDQLKAGCEYVLERGVEKYSGVITWQISIERSSKKDGVYVATGLKYIKTGISAIQNKGEKEIIRVLQIASDYSPSIFLPTTKNIEDSGAVSLTNSAAIQDAFKDHVFNRDGTKVSDNQAKTTGLFYYYLRNIQDYEIIIERCFVSEYNVKMNALTAEINLNDYQMIILGFADMYSDITSDYGRDAIETFINQGKTVLFTHDTTMYGSDYKLSIQFRDQFGMDRFGTSLMKESLATLEELQSSKYDLAYYPNAANNAIQIDIGESYGFTNQHMNRFRVAADSNYFNKALSTKKVTNINKGQITDYPYDIPDELDVLLTHAQYFQLNMEDPEVVVWYSLANNTTQAAYDKNDGRNGYYIYNKGNITYSGAGHILGDLETVMPDNEVKLFVNTIIAAYRATPSAVKVVVTNEDKSSNEAINTDYLLVDYDAENKEMAFGSDIMIEEQTKRIKYKLNDQSLFKDSKFYIEYFVKIYHAEEDKTDFLPLVDVITYGNSGEIGRDQIKANTDFSYYFDVNLEKLKDATSMDLVLKLTLTYEKEDGTEMHLESERNVQLLRRELFNLD